MKCHEESTQTTVVGRRRSQNEHLTEVSMELISADVTQRRYAAATQQSVDRVPQLTRCRLLGVNLLLPELLTFSISIIISINNRDVQNKLFLSQFGLGFLKKTWVRFGMSLVRFGLKNVVRIVQFFTIHVIAEYLIYSK